MRAGAMGAQWKQKGREAAANAIELSARGSLALYEPYHQLLWLADPRRREVLEELADWPFVRHAEPDPAIDELLLGTSPLTVDEPGNPASTTSSSPTSHVTRTVTTLPADRSPSTLTDSAPHD